MISTAERSLPASASGIKSATLFTASAMSPDEGWASATLTRSACIPWDRNSCPAAAGVAPRASRSAASSRGRRCSARTTCCRSRSMPSNQTANPAADPWNSLMAPCSVP